MLRRKLLILAVGILAGSLALAAPSYYPAALGDFGGAADYLNRGSDLAGNVDSKKGTLSIWLRLDGSDGDTLQFFDSVSQRFSFIRQKPTDGGRLKVSAKNTAQDTILALRTGSTFVVTGNWVHLLCSWNLATASGYLYIDDVSSLEAGPTLTDDEIDYTVTLWTIASSQGFQNLFDGALAEVYFNTAEYLDLSIEANRRLFISADGYPVYLGADGSLPTGTAPIIYMKERANNCGINSGTGGDFTINGAPLHTDGPAGPFFPFTTEIPARGRGSRMHRQELFQ